MKSPMADETVATFIAFDDSPFCDNGNPSIWVAAAAAVPGVLNRIAAIDPP